MLFDLDFTPNRRDDINVLDRIVALIAKQATIITNANNIDTENSNKGFVYVLKKQPTIFKSLGINM